MFSQPQANSIILTHQNGEQIELKEVLKVDGSSNLVLFSTNKEVQFYLDPQLYILTQDQDLSQDLFLKGYINKRLTKIQTTGPIEQDRLFYMFPSNHSHIETATGAPIFNKNGELIAIQAYNYTNFVVALKASFLDKFIKEANNVTNCSGLDLNTCFTKVGDDVFTQIQKNNPFAYFNASIAFLSPRMNLQAQAYAMSLGVQNFINPETESILQKQAMDLSAEILHKNNDSPQAFTLYKKAADQGFVPSQHNLGVMYLNGNGVEQNYDKAVEYFKKAASNNYSISQYNLGVMYLNGKWC